MKEKLQALMKSEGLKSSQLAEILEINPSGLSHIMAERNRPGLDVMLKILRRFPHINPDWLLLDSQQMYRDTAATPTAKAPATNTPSAAEPMLSGLFASLDPAPATDSNRRSLAPGDQEPALPFEAPTATNAATDEIERIVVLYTDGTFKSFVPTKR